MVKLSEGTGVNANNGIICGVLVTVGDLARVVGDYMVFFFTFLLMFRGLLNIYRVFCLLYLYMWTGMQNYTDLVLLVCVFAFYVNMTYEFK